MNAIKTTIDIGASAETVWRILTNFSAYPTWNPFLREVHGKAQPGAKLKVRMRLSKKRSQIFSPRVTKAIPAAELHWRGKMLFGGLFDGEHSFIIVPNGVNGVRFIQREVFTGLLVSVILPFIAKGTEDAFERMNKALKKAAEGKGGGA
jgi:hypothetical protein